MCQRRDRLRGYEPVNRWIYLFMDLFMRRPIQWALGFIPENIDVIPKRGAAILVANHVHLMDPIWIFDALKRPVYWVATEELFRKRLLGWFIRTFGAFPKRKAAHDNKTFRSMVKALANGDVLGIYPEGVRTWDGSNAPLIPTIARLIRRFKVPVYACRVSGGYLAQPRWAARSRRIRARLVFSKLYDRDAIPQSEQTILEDISRAIATPDYHLKAEELGGRRWGLAEGIEKVLYRCPHCESLESLAPLKPLAYNLVECRTCQSRWRVDITSRLTPVGQSGRPTGPSATLAELYARIRSMPLRPIRSSLIRLDADEKLFLVSRTHLLYSQRRFPRLRLFGLGRAFLTDRRFIFRGRLKGRGRIRLSASLHEMDSLSIEPGDKLHFVYRGLLYRLPFRRESALKWMDSLQRLQNPEQQDAAAAGASSGEMASVG
ncbi:MAG: 1-acyl-sn-glycerol-3-phosphate acyltransferase [Spirochaetales bacterium]|nr:1-acyl-sn-glycerol-3-phosphate acyltransferase [Spirochaetales bacterium]